ncbi:hypothetical protein [Deinococcus aluminii]|uniref:Uncharacterized protein n=1 Tax=Deinococcus aluminii TaxID=1656885 RepID=A0ABP9XIM4_9DEIO
MAGFWFAALIRAVLLLGVPLALLLVVAGSAGSPLHGYFRLGVLLLLGLAVWVAVSTLRRYRYHLSEAAREPEHIEQPATVILRR